MKCFNGGGQNVAYFEIIAFFAINFNRIMKNKMCWRMVLTLSIDDVYAINNILLRKHFSFDCAHKTHLHKTQNKFTKDTSTSFRPNNTDGQHVRNTFGDS